MTDEQQTQMDVNNLYREETYTDQKVGTIRAMIPIKADGERDLEREVEYFGQAQVMTPAGALPINFIIEGTDLKTAVENYGEAAQKGLEQTMEELKEMRRQQASSIVVPGQEGMGGMGGMPGGGIQIP